MLHTLKENTILYSKDASENYEVYVGVGNQDSDPNQPDSYLLPDDRSEAGWIAYSQIQDSIAFVVSIHYMLLQDYYEDNLPAQAVINFKANLAAIKEEVEKWFMPDTSVFHYLEIFADEEYDFEEIEDPIYKYHLGNGAHFIVDICETDKDQCFIPVSSLPDLHQSNERLCKLIFTLS